MSYAKELASINDADEQMEIVEPLALRISEDPEARTAELAEAILRMFERNPEADGFGTFGTLISALEEVDPDVLRPLAEASVKRVETWANAEVLEMCQVEEE